MSLALYLAGRNGTLTGSIEPNHAAFDGPSWVLAMIGTGMIGAQVIVGEHASGLIRTTFIAVPARRRVAAAKAVVVASVTAVVALLVAVGGLALVAVIGDSHGRTVIDSASLRAIGASAVVLPVCALAGLAAGALLRNPAVTGFTVCTVLGFGPLLVHPGGNRWGTDVANALPYYAWGRLTSAGGGSGGTMTAGVAWCTLAAWAALSIVITTVVLDRRDV